MSTLPVERMLKDADLVERDFPVGPAFEPVRDLCCHVRALAEALAEAEGDRLDWIALAHVTLACLDSLAPGVGEAEYDYVCEIASRIEASLRKAGVYSHQGAEAR